MAMKFNIHEIVNGMNPEAPNKFYLRPISSGEKTLDELAADIAHSSSLTEADVYAVLQSLVREIPRAIADGYIVRLGNLGSFRMSVNSADQVSEQNITKRRLIFNAGKAVKKDLYKIKFKRNT